MLGLDRFQTRAGRFAVFFLILGVYLSLRGYHSRDGDQAYRLVLLLDRQDPTVYPDDPFVRSFDAFNPHQGYLALLDLTSRALGLSAALALLFGSTFLATCAGVDRMTRAVWPGCGQRVGYVAIVLLLTAKAGNLGTNHLFEAMLLDRLMALALGWLSFSKAVIDPDRGRLSCAALLGLATWIHPSLGLQLVATMGAAWIGWAILRERTGVGRRSALETLCLLGLAILPGLSLIVGQSGRLTQGLPEEEFRLLSVTMQGPQHMVPDLWRFPQWIAGFAYLAAALLALRTTQESAPISEPTKPRVRLVVLFGAVLAGLGVSWIVLEATADLRLTLFQPFRLATLARGLALILLAGRLTRLWERSDLSSQVRAALYVAGLSGDWAFVVAVGVDLTASLLSGLPLIDRRLADAGGLIALAYGLWFLSRHDTESGHRVLLLAIGLVVGWRLLARSRGERARLDPRRRFALACGIAWTIPALAAVAPCLPGSEESLAGRIRDGLIARCRFWAVPTDDLERLAVWCRDHTPADARFIGPPGPKTFRLWSERSVAFNRASSPYHAAGLGDWARRYRDHVRFEGATAEFVAAYLADRHGLERRYQEMSDADRAALARRHGADYVLAAAPDGPADGPLELLKVEGRYAVYRVRGDALADRGRPISSRR